SLAQLRRVLEIGIRSRCRRRKSGPQLTPIDDLLQLFTRYAELAELARYDLHSVPVADRRILGELGKRLAMQIRAAPVENVAQRFGTGNEDLDWRHARLHLSGEC